jgi:predicted MFS family arabinose efflux permease
MGGPDPPIQEQRVLLWMAGSRPAMVKTIRRRGLAPNSRNAVNLGLGLPAPREKCDRPAMAKAATKHVFSRYQVFVIAILAFLQFTIILDFMIVSPLGAMVMPRLHITPQQFAWVVSSYAFSAGLSGLAAAGFADRFDRKRLLLFFYIGFTLGTLLCGLATTYPMLLMARIVTGLFGGVIGSVVLAIATDLFALEVRGRVMGFIQTAFAASQVLGLPMGLFLSNRWDWHAPYIVLAELGLAGLAVIWVKLKPVDAHLGKPQEHSPFMHLFHTITEPRHLLAFLTVTLLATGGFMLMPFSSAFLVHNIGISLEHLPTIYFFTGICTIVFGPLIGKAADKFGKFRVFVFGSALTISMILVYTHLGPTPLPVVVLVNVAMFVGIFSRMIPFQALASQIPEPTKRGAFNAISASIQQVSGGLASVVAGHIVTQAADGSIQHFPEVGYVVVGTTLVGIGLVWNIQRQLRARAQA